MFRIEYLGLLGALMAVSGCSSWQQSLKTSDSILGVITPYRVEVVQGNVVTREQIELVKPGMNRAQVRNVLGSPLLTDLFHENRWDYIFTIKRQGTEPQRRSVVLMFDGDTLKSIDAPDLPGEQDFVASISPIKVSKNEPKLELTEEQRKALPIPPKPEPAASAPDFSGPTRPYPPLEAAK